MIIQCCDQFPCIISNSSSCDSSVSIGQYSDWLDLTVKIHPRQEQDLHLHHSFHLFDESRSIFRYLCVHFTNEQLVIC
jgi:hypothetical protein